MTDYRLPPPKLEGGPYLMGILNVTPDSFSDGGQWDGAAAPHGLAMLEAGADIIDVGGESTRPGAAPVEAGQEIARVVPVIAALRAASKSAAISIDTMKPAVAMAAMASGASLWNDVTALRAAGALETAASLHRPVVLMHMLGEPRTMQADPRYDDVVAEVIAFLRERVAKAQAKGITDIWVDPGIGFGKTLAHNLALLNATARIRDEVGRPVMLGVSRKSFLAKIDAGASDARGGRLGGSIAAAVLAAQAGAAMLRVHDVAETVQALKVWKAAQRN